VFTPRPQHLSVLGQHFNVVSKAGPFLKKGRTRRTWFPKKDDMAYKTMPCRHFTLNGGYILGVRGVVRESFVQSLSRVLVKRVWPT
jgi:hypothetical protein